MKGIGVIVLAVLLSAVACSARPYGTPKSDCSQGLKACNNDPHANGCASKLDVAVPICACNEASYWDKAAGKCAVLPAGAMLGGWRFLSDSWSSPTFKPVSMGWLFFGDKKTWVDAANTCMVLGGSLVSIKDEGQNTLLRRTADSFAQISGGEMHIGKNTEERRPESSDIPRDWYWYTTDKRGTLPGRYMFYNNWQHGMPDGKSKPCGRMLASGEWANGPCSNRLPFVCELPL